MKDAGITAPVPRGDWLGNVNYYFLNIVNHNGISWIAKRENMGQEPSDGLYWQRFGTSVPIATTSVAGIVKPDGTTISVDANGVIEVKIDGESIFIDDEDDTIKAKLSTLADVDTTDLADGYVLAWNATSETWEAVEKGGGGILPHLIIITEPNETSVKAVKGQTEIVAVETSSGHYECDLPEFGTWTIHAILNGDDAQVSLVVDTVKVYTVDDSHFHADITVTYPTGATVSCSKSGETTLYATGSPYTFTVHSAGTWTITCEVNGKTYTQAVNVTTTGQTFSYTLPVGSTVTPTDDVKTLVHCAGLSASGIDTLADLLADSTILLAITSDSNAVDYLVRSKTFIGRRALVPIMTSNTTPSGVVSASTETFPAYYAFNNDDSNFWTSALSDGQYIEYDFGEGNTHVVDKVSIKPRYTSSAFVKNFIVKGSNNGTTWDSLYSGTHGNNGNLEDFTFTNNNPYRYYRVYNDGASYADASIQIARLQFYSMEGMCDNSTAMTDIGANNYCANTLLADSDWCDAICNSTYFESVLNVKVPTMTSNTEPSGECSANGQLIDDGMGYPWNGFDNNLADYWRQTASSEAWLRYDFEDAITVYKCIVKIPEFRGNIFVKNIKLQGSNDGTNWVDLMPLYTTTNGVTNYEFKIDGSTSYSKYRLYCSGGSYYSNNDIRIHSLQVYGR